MPDVYVTTRDLRSHFDVFDIDEIMCITEMLIDEMDEWLEHNFHITDARKYYEYVLGAAVYDRLLHSAAPLEDYRLNEQPSLNGIPFKIDYHRSNECTITLRCKGDALDMPYRGNYKSFDIKQTLNGFYGIKAFDNVTPTKVIFNGPATIVFWSDKTKTIVKRADNELDDKEKALAMCLLKKNEKLFKFCRKEAAKQEDKECETLHDAIERIFNALTVKEEKDGK